MNQKNLEKTKKKKKKKTIFWDSLGCSNEKNQKNLEKTKKTKKTKKNNILRLLAGTPPIPKTSGILFFLFFFVFFGFLDVLLVFFMGLPHNNLKLLHFIIAHIFFKFELCLSFMLLSMLNFTVSNPDCFLDLSLTQTFVHPQLSRFQSKRLPCSPSLLLRHGQRRRQLRWKLQASTRWTGWHFVIRGSHCAGHGAAFAGTSTETVQEQQTHWGRMPDRPANPGHGCTGRKSWTICRHHPESSCRGRDHHQWWLPWQCLIQECCPSQILRSSQTLLSQNGTQSSI